MSDHTATGACLCGAVRYQLDGPFGQLTHCHCSVCRKHHGAAFASFVASPLKGFRYLSGEHHVSRYDSSSTWYRPFCLTCGSVLPTRMPEHNVIVSPAGSLAGDLGVRPGKHMFVASKAPWYDITDDLPQYAEYPPEMFGSAVGSREPEPASPGCTGGSCVCGKVAFEYEGAPLRMLNCHCSRCRRGRSAAHTTNLFVRPAVPVIFSQDVPDPNGGFNSEGVDLGDISFDAALGRTLPGGIVVLGGLAGTMPTATNDARGLDQ